VEGENTQLVQRAFEAFAARDVEGMTGLLDPEMEFVAPTASLAGQKTPYRGLEGLRAYFDDVSKIWEEIQAVPHEYREVNDKVLVLGRVYARGVNGLLVDSPAGWVWRVGDGKIVAGRVYTSRDEAMRAAGVQSG
jgi:ketosteroid isomerase-like protein